MARHGPGLWAMLLTAIGGARRAGAAVKDISRLKMVNGCMDEPIWIAHMAIWPENGGVGPDPQNIKLKPGESFAFRTPPGLSGTRYWPKMGCDDNGNDCKFGDSGGPDEICNIQGCAPPVDTKFEASFGKDKNDQDWVDISLVDGYTLPFRFELDGKCGAGFDGTDDGGEGVETNSYYSIDADWEEHCDATSGRRYYRSSDGTTTFNPPRIIDCSRLDFAHCPEGEDISGGGAKERKNVSLKVKHPSRGNTVGCYSPCSQLSLSHWSEEGAKFYGPPDDEAAPYCCPTPPESPESCRKGPVADTKFVKGVHEMCPGVYGYSYDDGMGLLQCPPDTKYKVTFYCPVEKARPAPQNDPLLPELKLLRSSECKPPTTTRVAGGLGYVPEYVPNGGAQPSALPQQQVPLSPLEPTGPEPANLPEFVPTQQPMLDLPPSKDVWFESVTSTTTHDTTLPGIIVNDAAAAPDLPPQQAAPMTLPPVEQPTPAPTPPPPFMTAATPMPVPMGIPALAPPPVPPPTAKPEPAWIASIRRMLETIGLASKPKGGVDSSAGSSDHRALHVLGFLALLSTFLGLSGWFLWRTCVPQQVPVYDSTGQYGQWQPLQFSGGPAGMSGGASVMPTPGGYYPYR